MQLVQWYHISHNTHTYKSFLHQKQGMIYPFSASCAFSSLSLTFEALIAKIKLFLILLQCHAISYLLLSVIWFPGWLWEHKMYLQNNAKGKRKNTKIVSFLAVQDSSIGDIVSQSVSN